MGCQSSNPTSAMNLAWPRCLLSLCLFVHLLSGNNESLPCGVAVRIKEV